MTYLDWLKNQIEYFDSEGSFDYLLDQLYSVAYVPLMERDQNRYADGLELRDEYFKDFGEDANIIDSPCSFLEFLIALARRMNYIYADIHEDRTQDMFWTMLRNAGLDGCDDGYHWAVGDDAFNEDVEYVVDRIINREFDEDGRGGLFPLNNPTTNQRNVEIWYQMNQYLVEVMKEEGRL